MAIKLNGNDITSNKLNNSNVTNETLNGSLVYPVNNNTNATDWQVYSENPYDAQEEYTYLAGRICPLQDSSFQAYRSTLIAERPPGNYQKGLRMGIQASTGLGTCAYVVFIAV